MLDPGFMPFLCSSFSSMIHADAQRSENLIVELQHSTSYVQRGMMISIQVTRLSDSNERNGER